MKSACVLLSILGHCRLVLGNVNVAYTVGAKGEAKSTSALVVEKAGTNCSDFGFDLEDLQLTAEQQRRFTVPADNCFYPVTLQSLIDEDHLEYTWLPQTMVDTSLAPSGAYLYKMGSG